MLSSLLLRYVRRARTVITTDDQTHRSKLRNMPKFVANGRMRHTIIENRVGVMVCI